MLGVTTSGEHLLGPVSRPRSLVRCGPRRSRVMTMPAPRTQPSLAAPDIRALELVNAFVHEPREKFEERVQNTPVQVIASLVRLAQPSYATQYRETTIAAVIAGLVTSWISWTMVPEPKSKAARDSRLRKTLRNAALGVAVTLIVSRMRHLRSPERDALQVIRRLFPKKVHAAEQLVHSGYATSLLPALGW